MNLRLRKSLISIAPLLILLAVMAVVFKSSLRLNYFRYATFNSNKFDLGIMAQTVWNTAHGRFFEFTDHYGTNMSQAGTHTDYLMILFAPLFLIWEDPRLLLFVQSLILVSGALPLYLLARKKLGSDWLGLVWGLAFLVYPAIGFLLRSDFHSVTLTIPLFLWSFYFFGKNQLAPFWVCIILALLGKEEVSLIVFMLGLYIWLVRKKQRLGVMVSLAGLFWAFLSFAVIIPYYGQVRRQGYEEFLKLLYGQYEEGRVGMSQNFFLARYSQFGDSYFGIAKNILFRPFNTLRFVLSSENLTYLFKILSPLGFLSFLTPLVLLISLPELAINLLSNNLTMKTIRFQYVATIVPFVFLSALYGVVWLRDKMGGRRGVLLASALSGVVLLGSLWGTAEFNSPLWPYFKSGGPLVKIPRAITRIKDELVGEEVAPPAGTTGKEVAAKPQKKERSVGERVENIYLGNPKHSGAAAEVVRLIPEDPAVSVSAPNFLGAHLSLRESLALSPGNYQEADYVVVDLVLPQFLHSVGEFEVTPLIPRYVKDLLGDPNYTLVRSGGGLLVFERGSREPRRVFSIEEVPSPTGQKIAFTWGVRLERFEIPEEMEVGEKTELSFYWSSLPNLKKSVFFVSTLKSGGRVFQEVHLPSLALLPVDQWEAGPTYREIFELELPENLPSGDYEFILSVIDFDNRESVESRYLQTVEVE